MSPSTKTTVDGLETTLAVNQIAHQYLVRQLLPLLRQSKGRVVVVTSSSHQHTGLKPDMTVEEKIAKLCSDEYSGIFGYRRTNRSINADDFDWLTAVFVDRLWYSYIICWFIHISRCVSLRYRPRLLAPSLHDRPPKLLCVWTVLFRYDTEAKATRSQNSLTTIVSESSALTSACLGEHTQKEELTKRLIKLKQQIRLVTEAIGAVEQAIERLEEGHRNLSDGERTKEEDSVAIYLTSAGEALDVAESTKYALMKAEVEILEKKSELENPKLWDWKRFHTVVDDIISKKELIEEAQITGSYTVDYRSNTEANAPITGSYTIHRRPINADDFDWLTAVFVDRLWYSYIICWFIHIRTGVFLYGIVLVCLRRLCTIGLLSCSVFGLFCFAMTLRLLKAKATRSQNSLTTIVSESSALTSVCLGEHTQKEELTKRLIKLKQQIRLVTEAIGAVEQAIERLEEGHRNLSDDERTKEEDSVAIYLTS
ncbi:unnamed protein product, partial [Heligmosomoides polygyrus]|uniref:Plastid division1 n=1 Tax=Heligmosomoides polygyrus TaxID=6339 RepID=A0A183F9L6_HELPZ